MTDILGLVFLGLAAWCYHTSRKYDSTNYAIAIIGIICIILGIAALSIRLFR